MILKLFDKEAHKCIKWYGGTFLWEFDVIKKVLTVTTDRSTEVYKCDRMNYSVGAHFVYAEDVEPYE